MNEKQKLALRCAYADLLGALQSYENGDLNSHDWKAHEQTLADLVVAFPKLDLEH